LFLSIIYVGLLYLSDVFEKTYITPEQFLFSNLKFSAMTNNADASYSSNVTNFETLISSIIGFGPAYNSSNPLLKLEAMQSLLDEGKAVLKLVKSAEANYKSIDSVRLLAFKPFDSTITRVMNAYKSIDSTAELGIQVRSLVNSIHGSQSKSKKTEKTDGVPASEDKVSRDITKHNQGYEARIENFERLIELLMKIIAYTPNESDLSIAGLKTFCDDLKKKNLDVVNATTQFNNARIARFNVLDKPVTGLTHVGLKSKNYIKSAFGATSPYYKQISKLRFRIHKN